VWKSDPKPKISHEIANADKWRAFVGAITEAQMQAEQGIPLPLSAIGEENNLLQESFEPFRIAQAPDLVFSLDQEGNVIGSTSSALALDPLPQPEFSEGRSGDLDQEQSELLFIDTIHEVLQRRRTIRFEYCTLSNRESRYEVRIVPSVQNQVIAVVRNITERRRSDALIAGENRILEMIAGGASLKEVLTGLVRLYESVFPRVICSVLLMDSDGYRLRHGAAPSLPDTYTSAIDGARIGPQAGSCGTAAYFKRRVIVTDIASDPLWTDYRDLAAEHGLRACWSIPILSRLGNVLGTFAMYYPEVASPTEKEIGLIETAAHIAGVAIERNHLEERVRESQKMEAFGQMAGGIAHDFNNILSVILGYTHLLLGDENFKGETKDHLMQVCAAGERAANLTRKLLTFSRKKDIELSYLDLNEVVRSIAKMLSRIIGDKVKLHCSYSDNLPTIRADEGMMEQMIINLALNGRDAMPTGGPLFIGTTTASLDAAYVESNPDGRRGDFVCLSVRDAGFGMTPEIKARIFEPFFTTKSVGKGSGLGLAVVHGIVKQHQGWIEVETEVGTGTTFKIFLPPSREPVSAQTAKELGARGGKETILLVDNELAARELSKVILQRYGYRVLAVRSGMEALREWAKHSAQIDLLLTDLVMPDAPTGRELAKQLISRKPTLKVIYSTGYASHPKTFRLSDAPMFVQKPYHPDKLAQVIRACLDTARK
jgi:signal transduction histidine kinase